MCGLWREAEPLKYPQTLLWYDHTHGCSRTIAGDVFGKVLRRADDYVDNSKVYPLQVRRKVLLLHGCEQRVVLKKTVSVMQQRIIHDETSQFLCRLPATISKRVA